MTLYNIHHKINTNPEKYKIFIKVTGRTFKSPFFDNGMKTMHMADLICLPHAVDRIHLVSIVSTFGVRQKKLRNIAQTRTIKIGAFKNWTLKFSGQPALNVEKLNGWNSIQNISGRT